MKKPLKIGLIIACAFVGVLFLLRQCARTPQRGLSELLPQITAITLYDVQDHTGDSSVLASVASAQFPLEAFQRAGATATSEGGVAVGKGSSLAVFTLRDGTKRQARFSYYGGFFTIDEYRGHFVVRGAGASELQRLHEQVVQERFVPRRHERNKNRNA